MLFGQRHQFLKVVLGRDRALGIGGGTQIGQGGAVQHLGRQIGIAGQMPGFDGGRNKDRLGPHGGGGDGIDLIEWIGDQHRRLLVALVFGRQRQGGVEQPLARAVQRHDAVGRHLDAVAALQPAADGRQQLGRALVGGILAEIGDAFGHDRPGKAGDFMARFADGHDDGIAAGRDARQQFPQARKCVIRQVRKPLGKCHGCLSFGVVAPRFCAKTTGNPPMRPEFHRPPAGGLQAFCRRKDGQISAAPPRPRRRPSTARGRRRSCPSASARMPGGRWAG